MIRILGICGSRVKDGNTEALLRAALQPLEAVPDTAGEILALAGLDIQGCRHCNWCVRHQEESRFCAQDDAMSLIYPRLVEADAVLLASPAHFGRLSGHLANMVDRLRVFVHGNRTRGRMKNKIGGALAVAYFRGGGLETTLLSINLLFFSLQMIVATSGLYQLGAGAVTSREGKGRFEKEPRHIVLEDDYGVNSARLLVGRMVELARIVQAGQAALSK